MFAVMKVTHDERDVTLDWRDEFREKARKEAPSTYVAIVAHISLTKHRPEAASASYACHPP
jgi:hypothetical protein